ncbi:MAG: transcriptional regulator [Clostridia bacterium]|mgnify:FL=1|nr:MAG: transcriptional regulator [Clostridia bacterium]
MTTGERMKQRRKEIGLSAETVAAGLGVSPATIYRYEKGEIEKLPGDVIEPLAKILHTTPAYLMGWEDDSVPELNARDRRDIARYMADMRERLASGEALMFDGEPLTPEAMDSILAAMQVGMEIAKKKNKEKYTPKKYRKE